MAPHWKCGSGQPVAGSNPALSAIRAGRDDGECVRWIGPLLRSRKPSGRWLAGASPRTSGVGPLAPVLLATGPPWPRRAHDALALGLDPSLRRHPACWGSAAVYARSGAASPATPSARGECGSAPSIPGGASTRRVGVEICRALARRGRAWRIPVGSASFSCDGSIGRIRRPRRCVRARGGNAHEPPPESPRGDPR
jgi:hypothetical protein